MFCVYIWICVNFSNPSYMPNQSPSLPRRLLNLLHMSFSYLTCYTQVRLLTEVGMAEVIPFGGIRVGGDHLGGSLWGRSPLGDRIWGRSLWGITPTHDTQRHIHHYESTPQSNQGFRNSTKQSLLYAYPTHY